MERKSSPGIKHDLNYIDIYNKINQKNIRVSRWNRKKSIRFPAISKLNELRINTASRRRWLRIYIRVYSAIK